ncbi:MAG: hypothetical protein WHU10_05295 [Fimbriimonadales bacterium]
MLAGILALVLLLYGVAPRAGLPGVVAVALCLTASQLLEAAFLASASRKRWHEAWQPKA